MRRKGWRGERGRLRGDKNEGGRGWTTAAAAACIYLCNWPVPLSPPFTRISVVIVVVVVVLCKLLLSQKRRTTI